MDQNIFTEIGSNIHASKLVINKLKKLYQDNLLDKKGSGEIPLENDPYPVLNFHLNCKTDESDLENKQLFVNSIQNRRFDDVDADKNEFHNSNFSSKFLRISDSNYLKEINCWKQYSTIEPYAIKSYSSLLSLKSLIPDFMDDCNFYNQINSLSSVCDSNCLSVHKNKSSSLFFVEKCLNSHTIEESFNIYNAQDIKRSYQFDSNSNYAPEENKVTSKVNNIANVTNDESTPSMQIDQEKNLSLQSLYIPISNSSGSLSKHVDKGKVSATDIEEIFTTAAGKSIRISNEAMLAGQRFIQSMFQDETLQRKDRAAHVISVDKKKFMKSTNVISCPTRSCKEDEITAGETYSENIENNRELCVSSDAGSLGFSTAAGKKIDVSEAALKAAHKLIQNAFDDEDKMVPSTSGSYNTCQKKRAFKDIGCPPKKLLAEDNDDAMDKDLVEKFFQDVVFDEKESEDISDSSKNQVLETKKNNDHATRKIRKSLGGRRSMRFYPDM